MNSKMKACFTGHVFMHSLFGLGLGLFLAYLIPALTIWWLGVLIMVIAVVADKMRK
jgi:Na+-translocating ferredoxin:NAD+ oxidoreductase RnfD subunit